MNIPIGCSSCQLLGCIKSQSEGCRLAGIDMEDSDLLEISDPKSCLLCTHSRKDHTKIR